MPAIDGKFAGSLPSQRALVERMGGPPAKWVARCHEASVAVVAELEEMGVKGAVVRRGWFIGRVVPGAYFHGRPCQHSWVELPDGQVCDPTRFAFTLDPVWPLWVGPGDEYDIAGMRSQGSGGSAPSSDDDDDGPTIELSVSSVDYFGDLLNVSPEFRAEPDDDGDFSDGWLMVTRAQAHYLAHLPVADREAPGVLSRFFAREAFEALEQAKLKVLIPMDRWDFVMGVRR
jgi:hypothetical protein